MRKTFISQNIGKETSPYLIQLFHTEGDHWDDAYPFKNGIKYTTSATGHLPGEPMHFRIWPIWDPDYLELRYAGGNEGTFSWETVEDGKSIINNGSTLCCSGSYTAPYYCNFNIYSPVSSAIVQTIKLEAFLGGESGEFINLGTLYITHGGDGVDFKLNFQGNILAVNYGTELVFYVGNTTTSYKVEQWVGTLTTNTLILPSSYVNDPNGWGFTLNIVSSELALDMPRKYYFKAYVDGTYVGGSTADSINGGLFFAGIYSGSCKTIELVWTVFPTNIISLRYDKYTPGTRTMSISVLAKYPLACDLSLSVGYSKGEDTSPIATWFMSKGSTSLQNKTIAQFGIPTKCLIINSLPEYDSTCVYAHNPYSNYVCFNIDDCPMYKDDLGYETWMDVATALWGGVSTKKGWPDITMTTENDEMAPFKYLSDDAKTLLFMWAPESMISVKQIKTLMWEDTKYPGGTQYIYYYPDYPKAELGEEIVNKGIFLSLDLNKATMEPAKWRGPID